MASFSLLVGASASGGVSPRSSGLVIEDGGEGSTADVSTAGPPPYTPPDLVRTWPRSVPSRPVLIPAGGAHWGHMRPNWVYLLGRDRTELPGLAGLTRGLWE